MSSIVVAGDTSGAITLAAPATAGTNTITLPASTGTAALTSDVIGVGQTWTNVITTPGRALATTYTNSTGKAIELAIYVSAGAVSTTGLLISINGGTAFQFTMNTNSGGGVGSAGTIIVPNGATYAITNVGTGGTLSTWWELR